VFCSVVWCDLGEGRVLLTGGSDECGGSGREEVGTPRQTSWRLALGPAA
jgi:hypothetical protein